jgi:hypothetical protein
MTDQLKTRTNEMPICPICDFPFTGKHCGGCGYTEVDCPICMGAGTDPTGADHITCGRCKGTGVIIQ